MAVHRQNVDVIAQFNKDGKVIPIRVRLEDEDGFRPDAGCLCLTGYLLRVIPLYTNVR